MLLNPALRKHFSVMCNLMTTETDNKKLIELLDKAEYLAGQFSGGYSGQFLSAEEFHLVLVDSITKLKKMKND